MIDILGVYFMWGVGVAVLACLFSESKLFHPIRTFIGIDLLYCPICMGFWLAAPALYHGMTAYLATVGFSNLWMLVILKTYRELDELNGEEDEETTS
jgi:hypothetical protein